MSKSTNRYGGISFQGRISIDAEVKPNARLLRQWERVEAASQKEFGKKYDALTDQQKSTLHFNLNTKKYEDKNVQGNQTKISAA